ncbi:Glutathione S-transferase Mu 1 [Fasciola gigantica]|uniref:glutathione transferase n=1 Tax=Fasciola gigantica TaxID=46835 RepID=A0A504YW63_FASGI|nr:Glutathione S-transferase Mu 1 [Fasciola gigantica]
MPATLGYWKLRGLAQPIRLLLEFVGEKYEEQIYERDDGEKWFSKKFELGLDLPNLPYYIDDKCKLTQSLAILRYIADKHGMSKCILRFSLHWFSLVGSTPEERARVSMIEGAAVDLRQGLSRISYDPKFEQLKEGYLKDLPTTMKMWSDFLGKNLYLRGTSLTMSFTLDKSALAVSHMVTESPIAIHNLALRIRACYSPLYPMGSMHTKLLVSLVFSYFSCVRCMTSRIIPLFAVAAQVSHVDFMVYEALDAIRYLEPHCLDHFPNLQQFMSRIEALPSIKAYMESNRFIKWPLNGWHAQFGGGDAPPSHEKK